ncbi:MAG: hypothetical protein QXO79_06355, partial [Nitrososphaerota archaeon]
MSLSLSLRYSTGDFPSTRASIKHDRVLTVCSLNSSMLLRSALLQYSAQKRRALSKILLDDK